MPRNRRGLLAAATAMIAAVLVCVTACSGGSNPSADASKAVAALKSLAAKASALASSVQTTLPSSAASGGSAGDVIAVPFGGDPCQSLNATDEAALNFMPNGDTVSTLTVTKSNGDITNPASAVGVGCNYSINESNGGLQSLIGIIYESPNVVARDRPSAAPSATPSDLPSSGFVDAIGQVEVSADGYAFQVVASDVPYNGESGAIAAAVVAHLSGG